jgi:hypothetical protein
MWNVRAAAAPVAASILLSVPPVSAPPRPAAQAASTLPPRIDSYVTRHVKLTPEERAQLAAGEPVTRMLDTGLDHEVAVFGAVWIAAPVAKYVAALKDIEQFEKGGNFLATKRISDPPRLEDFAAMRLPPEDLADLRTCKVGDCEIKLGETALGRLRGEIDWRQPTAGAQAEALVRRLAFEYVEGYLAGGNARLAAYRDSDRPTFAGKEFASMTERLPELTEHLPELKAYLLGFPAKTLPGSTSLLYWQEAKFGLKPTIRVNHLIIDEQPTRVAVANKMLYASHYFWTALELRVLVPETARGGFWFVSVNRSRSDGLTGFTGSLIRGKVRDEAEKGMEAALAITRSRMEGP